jgi:hypothetical protein
MGRKARNRFGSQERWASGAGDDREGDPGCDDREPDVDEEEGAAER